MDLGLPDGNVSVEWRGIKEIYTSRHVTQHELETIIWNIGQLQWKSVHEELHL